MKRVLKRRELDSQPAPWLPEPLVAEPAASAQGAAPGDWVEVETTARERGLAEGMRVAEEAYQAKLARLEALIEQVRAERSEFFARIEPEVVRLAVAIAEKVIQQELETRPEVVVEMVRAAMARLRDREVLRISLNPRDLERVREAKDDLVGAVDGVKKIDVIEDRRVDPGGCVIESPNGTLDARVRTQIEEIERALELAAPAGSGERDAGPEPVSGDAQ